MKITRVEVKKRRLKLKKPFVTALRAVNDIEIVMMRIELENGMFGIGTASPAAVITGETIQSMESIVKNILIPRFIGRNILQISSLSRAVQSSCIGNTSAKAGFELALFDTYSKLLGLPLYQVLGGETNVLENDLTISINETETMVEDSLAGVEKGFKTLKIKAGIDGRKDVERIKAIREAVGPSIQIRIDANQGWGKKEAVKIINGWEDACLQIELIEQPVPAGDIDSLKYVTDQVYTPIMADESVFSPDQALELIQKKAVDLLNIKLMKTGGIVRAMQIADIAEAGGIPCMMGSMMESVPGVLAAAHLACAHPNIVKIDLDAPLWLEDNDDKMSPFQGPIIKLNENPGIGYDFFTLN
ncbi:dipeptide epimerase [Domibacillus epiphyticus]|uniref:Dipeptide epimerase n=1 Tax=Domibacillus epiphyticus TaxID=1714355 RepID=A0A1V2A791_9BACI|nr:dipeptide epimerase [Domibacillus epiphyticus]OMP66826.1 dipeptide epimerase [Domibacillus epiphyticus]